MAVCLGGQRHTKTHEGSNKGEMAATTVPFSGGEATVSQITAPSRFTVPLSQTYHWFGTWDLVWDWSWDQLRPSWNALGETGSVDTGTGALGCECAVLLFISKNNFSGLEAASASGSDLEQITFRNVKTCQR